ncbi:MAG: phage/plasmid primase, P4 family [Victivallaceae bacterium]|nr:phage/plasmid primase, P4 family [Victivallaceae bacterium]
MITEEIIIEVIKAYGRPFSLNSKGNLTYFNEQFFAGLFHRAYSPVFIANQKQFFMFNDKNGCFDDQNSSAMINKLGLFLHEFTEVFKIPAMENKRTCGTLRNIMTFLESIGEQNDFFSLSDRIYIHCANGVLEFKLAIKKSKSKSFLSKHRKSSRSHNTNDLDLANRWELKPFSPDYRSLGRCELNYDPQAKCPQFEAFLHSFLEDDDIELIKQYIGQCLLGKNITHTMLVITGPGGCGKSTLETIIELLIGANSYTQIRPEHIGSRFETSFFMGKTLLSGKESRTSFFTSKGMGIIKSLVGGDGLRAEEKNSNKHKMVEGTFNVIIVGNSIPKLQFESNDDKSSYHRRFRWIRCKDFKPENPIPNLAKKIFSEEGSGILNFALDGAKKILESNIMPCGNLQNARLDYLFGSSEPLDLFLASCVETNRNTTITSEELFTAFTKFSISMGWTPWRQRHFQNQIPDAMLRHFQQPLRREVPRRRASDGKMTNRAGFFHVRFKN